jgi:hypothetical protein
MSNSKISYTNINWGTTQAIDTRQFFYKTHLGKHVQKVGNATGLYNGREASGKKQMPTNQTTMKPSDIAVFCQENKAVPKVRVEAACRTVAVQ